MTLLILTNSFRDYGQLVRIATIELPHRICLRRSFAEVHTALVCQRDMTAWLQKQFSDG